MFTWNQVSMHRNTPLGDSVSSGLFSDVPLQMVHLFTVHQEVTGGDIITSYFWVGRTNAIQQTPIRGSGWVGGFFKHRKACFGACCYSCAVLLLSSRYVGVPKVAPLTPPQVLLVVPLPLIEEHSSRVYFCWTK